MLRRTEHQPIGEQRWLRLLITMLLLVAAHPSWAKGEFVIRRAETTLRGNVYYLDARIDYDLGRKPSEALDNGVPLVIELQIEVLQERQYLWAATHAQLRQRFSFKHHALTQRYIVTNLNSGVRESFESRAAALASMGDIRSLPILDASLLDADEEYRVRMRAILDMEALPAPLRLLAYVTGGWRVSSDWREWPL